MKKSLLALCLIIFSISSFSQYADTLSVQQKQEMLAFAQKKRNTGVVLLSVGCATIVAGAIILANAYSHPEYHGGGNNFTYPNEGLGAAIFLCGGALNLISIPFWKTSNKIRRKVKNAHIGLAPSLVPANVAAGSIHRTTQASLSLQIPLGR